MSTPSEAVLKALEIARPKCGTEVSLFFERDDGWRACTTASHWDMGQIHEADAEARCVAHWMKWLRDWASKHRGGTWGTPFWILEVRLGEKCVVCIGEDGPEGVSPFHLAEDNVRGHWTADTLLDALALAVIAVGGAEHEST